jgi:chromosome partitioning protein
MKTISLVSQKGGVGKSTLASNLAAYASSKGLKTTIIDLDKQSSLTAWYGLRLRHTDDVALLLEGMPLVDQIKQQEQAGFDLCIIDTPPHNSTEAANAVRASDITIVPVRASAFDLIASQPTFELLASGKGGVVLNAVPSSSAVKDSAIELVKQNGLKVLAVIGQRVAFQHAISFGKGVTEYQPKSKASEEIKELWETIIKL